MPWDIAQGVQQRVALLPAAGQDLLAVAAVVGRRASRALLVAVAEQPEEAALAGLDAACRARLLLEDGADAYAFAHDVIREVVEADLGTARRAMLHRKVAAVLDGDQAGASSETLAYHYARGDAPDKAVRYLEQAGDHAWAQHAHASAEGHYREALDCLERLGRDQDGLRVREKLGSVLTRTGRYEAALQVLEPAAAAYHATGDWEGLGRAAARIAETDVARGAFEEGLARLQPLLEHLERDGVPAPPAALYVWWGISLLYAGRYDESLAALEQAAELARATRDGHTLVRAIWNRAYLLQRLGQLEEAVRANQEVLSLAEARNDLEALLSVHRNLAYILALQGEFGTGRRHIDRSLALAEQLENPANRAVTLALRGWLATLAGDWQSAHADLDLATASSRQVALSWYSPYPLIFAARLALAEGDSAGATAAVREALAMVEGGEDLQALRWAATTMAEIAILEDHPEAAMAHLLPLLARPGLQECDVTVLLPVLAWAQLELDQREAAAGTVEQALARARPEAMRLVLVEALRVQALVAVRRGQWDEAARSLDEGLALARAMPYPYAETRLLHVYGQLHAGMGEPAPARERLEAALTLSRRIGARRDTTQLERAVESLPRQQDPFQNSPSPEWPLPPGGPRLTDAQWAAIATLLPQRAHTGRPRADDRQTIEAILYKLETGCAWRLLPAALGDGVTAHRRLRAWEAAGVWTLIAAIAHAEPCGLPSL